MTSYVQQYSLLTLWFSKCVNGFKSALLYCYAGTMPNIVDVLIFISYVSCCRWFLFFY